jgi:NADP-dependent 3-hydroxy acid dehydrogenase YdfG
VSTDQNSGHVAVIPGASFGIGDATARALAADGHRVALLARRVDRIHALAVDEHAPPPPEAGRCVPERQR